MEENTADDTVRSPNAKLPTFVGDSAKPPLEVALAANVSHVPGG